jgi:hypothetical protein
MEYRVAYDVDQSMERNWDTGGKTSVVFRIPVCFVVDKSGTIRFVGHPEDSSLERMLKEVLNEKH